jgi:ribokinase
MREWDATGRVQPRVWATAAKILPHADALILSDEDLGNYADKFPSYVALAPLVALTLGDGGVIVYRKDKPPLDVPAFPSEVVDLTGAGDSFAAGFLIALHESGDIFEAARFGNATAALAIESLGAETMPTRPEVEARLASG